ncbi:CesT family type III secretion system chaperone [Trinickia sp. LjRoot230]|uniref:CesT family type III secretion system chaperone n=1 Tax=Trinickia sp. LjRoot230 TaxID=3342288 RepID=UPI003ECF2A75
MSAQLYEQLVTQLCDVLGFHNPRHVLDSGALEIEDFEVRLAHLEADNDAMYMNFHFGTVTAGRTLTVFRLMLEANLLIYAQEQAQLGLDSNTGGIVLIVRVVMDYDIDGDWLADLLEHYADHGRYWRKNIIESADEMFDGIASGMFIWLRA